MILPTSYLLIDGVLVEIRYRRESYLVDTIVWASRMPMRGFTSGFGLVNGTIHYERFKDIKKLIRAEQDNIRNLSAIELRKAGFDREGSSRMIVRTVLVEGIPCVLVISRSGVPMPGTQWVMRVQMTGARLASQFWQAPIERVDANQELYVAIAVRDAERQLWHYLREARAGKPMTPLR